MRKLLLCMVCLMVFAPRAALALKLGAIEIRSMLHEPLDARIPLHEVRADTLEGMKVVLGSPSQFEIAGMEWTHHLALIEFTVDERDDGNAYIHLHTPEPIVRPLLTLLVNVKWSHGHLVRGYRLYLIPPIRDAADASTIPQTAFKAERGLGSTAPAPDSPSPDSSRAVGAVDVSDSSLRMSGSAAGEAAYGPARAKDTLWTLAARLRPDDSVSVQRMMLALLEANPEAFTLGNVNGLNEGVILRIPARDEIGPDDTAAAIAEVRRQHSAWKQYREERYGVPTRAAPVPTPAAPAGPVPTPAPSSPETKTAVGGRLEVVSPETSPDAAPGEAVNLRALRNELALAVEEADAKRLENEEIMVRLTGAEQQVEDLLQLVEIKDEEITVLQLKLRELNEVKPAPAPSEAETTRAPTPLEAETAPERSETGIVPVPAATEPPKSMIDTALDMLPFSRYIPAANPVFLAGGAGLLLMLLGAVALLQRRRTSTGEGNAFDSAADSAAVEGGFRIADDTATAEAPDHAVVERWSSLAPDAGSMDNVEEHGVPRSGPDSPATKQATGPLNVRGGKRPRLAGTDADAGTEADNAPIRLITDSFDDRIRDDFPGTVPDSAEEAWGDEASGEYEFDVRGLADAAARTPSLMIGPTDRVAGGQALDRFGDRSVDAEAHAGKPITSARPTSGPTKIGADRTFNPNAGGPVAFEPGTGDSVDSVGKPYTPLDGNLPGGGGTERLAFDRPDAGEVQTKIDIAQVYIEMGDAENARRFIDEVLAEGGAEQREIALAMLTRLA